jgi:hypothetical protein
MESDIQNLPEVHDRLGKILKHDAKSYEVAAYALTTVGFAFMFFLPVIGALFLMGAAYLFYDHYRNNTQNARLVKGVITDRAHFRREDWIEDVPDKQETNFYELHLDISETYKMKKGELLPERLHPDDRKLEVNMEIYNSFQIGDRMRFVMTPANDLLGYEKEGEMILLAGKKTFSDGTVWDVSHPIVQLGRDYESRWKKLEE